MKEPCFLIICTNRTGSTVLRRSLDGHPDLSLHDELFLFGDPHCDEIRKGLSEGLYPRWDIDKLNYESDLIPIINSAFQKYNGFKVQVCARQIHKHNPAWVHLAHLPNLKVIHMRRRNKIRQMVSLEVALARDLWHVESNEGIPKPKSVFVDPPRLLRKAHHFATCENYFEAYFAHKENMIVWYEDLESDIQKVLHDAQEFLGVAPMQLEVPLKKMLHEPLSELVENYSELVSAAKGTEWEDMV